MTYNFQDEPTPILKTTVDATGSSVSLAEGTPQGDLLTQDFSGQQVVVNISPPDGWVLDEVSWTSGGSGTFAVPPAGEEHVHDFTYKVSQTGMATLSNQGKFKIKKAAAPGS